MIWAIAIAVLGLAFVFLSKTHRASQQQNSGSRRNKHRENLGKVIDYSQQNRGTRREQWQNDSASEVKLEQMVGAEAADRLIVNVLLNNPSRSRAWCADKALQDLRRDRQRS